MKQSPMLKHAIESFEHGLEHFLDGTDRSRKFALLHIDHSIELMLKEKCVMLGKSIFKGDGTTLSIHEAFNSLKKESISIPEQPRLEDLHDLRNTIQHKGLIPDPLTAQFHVEIAYDFVKRFLESELAIPLHEALPSRYILFMGGVNPVAPSGAVQEAQGNTESTTLHDVGVLSGALRDAWHAENATSQIIAAYSVLVQAVRILVGASSSDERVKLRKTLREAAIRNGVSEAKIERTLRSIFMIRGQALKADHEVQEGEALGMLKAVGSILQMIGFGAAVECMAQPGAPGDAPKAARS